MTSDLVATSETRRAYDHRLREQVCHTGKRCLPRHVAIPRSTVSSWHRRGVRPVVTIEPFDQDRQQLLPDPTIDVTVIKLIDGTRTYLQAVIDNFSRRIRAWRLASRLEPQTTCLVLAEAAKNLPKNGDGATLIADSGIENVNGEVDNLFGLGQLHRILAQVEVSYSNSMIEALWRSMKHGWLFLNPLDTFAALEKLIAFYVEQHNSVVPHSAFAGQTPDEMYFGRGDQVPVDLAMGRARAREVRMKSNRDLSCEACRPAIRETPGSLVSSVISSVLQLHDEISAMS